MPNLPTKFALLLSAAAVAGAVISTFGAVNLSSPFSGAADGRPRFLGVGDIELWGDAFVGREDLAKVSPLPAACIGWDCEKVTGGIGGVSAKSE
jgi:hypothetical protein